ncbi:GIY-YIG nuclease family protein [Vibrio sp. RC27]
MNAAPKNQKKITTIYCLGYEDFKSKKDFELGEQSIHAFYVGYTTNPTARFSSHKSDVKKQEPKYPYHQALKELNRNWELIELESFNESELDRSDAEEYWILKLMAEGNPILNIRRGSFIRGNSAQAQKVLSQMEASDSAIYSRKKKKIDYEAKSYQVLRKRLSAELQGVGVAEDEESFQWQIRGNIIQAPRGHNKKQAIEWILNDHPSSQMYKLKKTIQDLIKPSST